MAKSIKLGADTYLDAVGSYYTNSNSLLAGELSDRLVIYVGLKQLSSMTLSSIGDYIKTLASGATHKVIVGKVGATNSSATSGYFGKSDVTFLFSPVVAGSTIYGSAILYSDNANCVVFGRLVGNEFVWYHPTLTIVS